MPLYADPSPEVLSIYNHYAPLKDHNEMNTSPTPLFEFQRTSYEEAFTFSEQVHRLLTPKPVFVALQLAKMTAHLIFAAIHVQHTGWYGYSEFGVRYLNANGPSLLFSLLYLDEHNRRAAFLQRLQPSTPDTLFSHFQLALPPGLDQTLFRGIALLCLAHVGIFLPYLFTHIIPALAAYCWLTPLLGTLILLFTRLLIQLIRWEVCQTHCRWGAAFVATALFKVALIAAFTCTVTISLHFAILLYGGGAYWNGVVAREWQLRSSDCYFGSVKRDLTSMLAHF